jgi:pyridoxal phosphate enzyme (YggS family)
MSQYETALDSIRARIAAAAARACRDPSDIRLVAVSKSHPFDLIREVFDCGQTVFGESRVQEALAKIPLLPPAIQWHFIGHLQSNKIRRALPHFTLFHGVDNAETAAQMDRIAAELGLFPRVLLEVNISGEGTKFGFAPDELRSQWEDLLALPRVQVAGLMTLAPYDADPEKARPHFAALRTLRDELQTRAGVPLPDLSMGMSGDFEPAIAEGATLVRVGSAIFGERRKKGAEP